jgi:hypothetical protein
MNERPESGCLTDRYNNQEEENEEKVVGEEKIVRLFMYIINLNLIISSFFNMSFL